MAIELEKLDGILQQLEGVYKSTINQEQKNRVKKEIEKVKKQIEHVKKYGENEVLKEDEPEAEVRIVGEEENVDNDTEKLIQNSKILSQFPIKIVHPLMNEEINAAVYYLQVFENELWGSMSDFHLKLDYYSSHEREKFYNKLEVVKRYVKQYMDTLEEISKLEESNVYAEKLKIMKNKQERVILIEGVKFMNEIDGFIESIINDYQNNQNSILNPNEKLEFSNIEGNKVLNGWLVIDILKFIRNFCKEFKSVIKIPDEILSLGQKENNRIF